MLHVATAQSRAAGVPIDGPEATGWDVLGEILREADENQDRTLAPELNGLTIHRVLTEGDPTGEIVEMAQQEKADLIMMPSHGFTFSQFLLGSVTAKVLHGNECPVWTGGHVEKPPKREFIIRNVLCDVDFKPHDRKTTLWATQISAEFGAFLTLAHVTPGVEFWGPGGDYVNPRWKKELVTDAARHIAELQQDLGIETQVFIGSGEKPEVLRQAVQQTKADLLVTGCCPYGGNLRIHGYAVIRAVPIPVLSV